MLEKINVEQLDFNVFRAIGKQWMLVTAGKPGDCNTMTASWGGLGVLWGAPAATAYIRPQRYTKEFLDREAYFTLSFLPEQYRQALAYCGSHSGRDGDKWAATGLTTAAADCGAAYVEQAELVLVCRKQFCQRMDPACILDREADARWYPDHDYHDIYIGEITEAYLRR
ncbi:MAG TPA: flavin reductase [Candidatus Onthomonas avicola]|nr:flavin reductase [Candidatus Onthomonas avicola]